MTAGCGHADQIGEVFPSDTAGCSDCLATGGRWVHLRMCLGCGRVGCCDSSPNRHASRHAAASAHPIAASFEPGEAWAWCYVDEVMLPVQPGSLPHRDPYPTES